MEKEKNRSGLSPQTIYNYVMGLLWTVLGLAFLFRKQLNLSFGGRLDDDPMLASIFGVAAILYGGFRLYRGFTHKQ